MPTILIQKWCKQPYRIFCLINVVDFKLWGDKNNEAIIVIHGVLDNAGAFDNLIPHLPTNFYYICVDLPGHGQSSSFHLSLPIHTIDYIIPVKIVADYFKREKYILIGHSLGGQLAMFYAHIYPNNVSKVILLDALYLYPFDSSIYLDMVEAALERLYKTIDQSQKPKLTYSYEEAVQKMINGRDHGMMTRASVEPLVKRMFEKVGEDKYVMNIDPRLKDRLYPSGTLKYLVDLHRRKPIVCPVLVLFSTHRNIDQIFEPLYKFYEERKYEMYKYDGHHDMHNTDPEVIAPFIVKFLLKSKL